MMPPQIVVETSPEAQALTSAEAAKRRQRGEHFISTVAQRANSWLMISARGFLVSRETRRWAGMRLILCTQDRHEDSCN